MENLLPKKISEEKNLIIPQYVKNDVNLYYLPFFSNKRWETKPRNINLEIKENNRVLKWAVFPHPEWGTPAFFEKMVFYAFLSIIEDNGLESFLVPFLFRDVLRRMGISENGRNIKKVRNAIDKIKFTGVVSEGVFYNKEKRTKIYDHFSLFERIISKDEEYEDPLTGVKKTAETNFLVLGSWLYSNLKSGYIAKIDYHLFQKMKPLEMRLYEFLLPNFYPIATGKSKDNFFKKSYSELCKFLPTHPYKHESEIKREFVVHIEALIKKGILVDYRIHRMNDKKDWTFYFYPSLEKQTKALPEPIRIEAGFTDERIVSLVERGISNKAAHKLVEKYPNRIKQHIEQFDWLKKHNSKLLKDNPAGFLRKSIEDNFIPPENYVSREEQLKIEARQARQRETEEQYRLAEKTRIETEKAQDAKVNEIISNLSEEEYQCLRQRAEQEAKEQYHAIFHMSPSACTDVKMKEIVRKERLVVSLDLGLEIPDKK